jgi:hypothetical protein
LHAKTVQIRRKINKTRFKSRLLERREAHSNLSSCSGLCDSVPCQPGALGFGLLVDGYIGIGVLPQFQEPVIGPPRRGFVPHHLRHGSTGVRGDLSTTTARDRGAVTAAAARLDPCRDQNLLGRSAARYRRVKRFAADAFPPSFVRPLIPDRKACWTRLKLRPRSLTATIVRVA